MGAGAKAQVASPTAGGSGITQLTADVTAGPGAGSQVATLVGTANVESIITANPTVAASATDQLTGDVTTPAGAGSKVATLVGTANVESIITANPTVAASATDQLTGDVTTPAGAGSQVATLVGTANVNTVVGDLATVATNVVRRSATASAGVGETTVFTGSTAGQTITLPPTAGETNAVYRIVNDATVSVTIAGGTNSLSVNGVISGTFVIPSNQSFDFVWDSTGIWQAIAIARNASAGALTTYVGSLATAVAMSAGVYTTIFTTPTLPVGIYNLNLQLDIQFTSSSSSLVTIAASTVVGTAAASFSGPSNGRATVPVQSAGVDNQVNLIQQITVTSPGTILLQGDSPIASNAAAFESGYILTKVS
jgi:hypothetical protein